MRALPLLVLAALAAAAPRNRSLGPDAMGRFFSAKEITKGRPALEMGPLKGWFIEMDDVGTMYLRLEGPLRRHKHPDGTHRIVILSGRMRLEIEGEEKVLGPGDAAIIPKGAAHKAAPAGREPVTYFAVDHPPISPFKFVWLEPEPAARVP